MDIAANGMTALAFLGAAIPVYILYQKRAEPGALYLMTLCLALVVYSCNLIVFPDENAVLLRYSVVSLVAPLYFLSVFAYLRFAPNHWNKLRNAIYSYMAFMLFAPWLAGDAYLAFAEQQPYAHIREYAYQHGPLVWTMMLVSYAFVTIAGLTVAVRFISSRVNRAHIVSLAVFPLITVLSDILAVLGGFSTYHGITVMQISATCTLFALTYALTRHQMLERVPVSRNTLMSYLREGVCVIGELDEVADCNATFAAMINVASTSLLGKPANHVLPEVLLGLVDAHRRNETVRDAEVALGDEKKFLSVCVTSIEGSGSLVLTTTDVTERKILLENVAHTATELQNANEQLEEMTLTDPLTGLGNRRKLQTVLQEDYAKPTATTAGLIMIDIDHFKAVNDTHGHEAGDQLLIALAGAMRDTCRENDVLVRWGGEEFIVLLPDSDERRLHIAAERLRLHIRKMNIEVRNNLTLRVTASIGATLIRPKQSPESALRQVDKLLYQAKLDGRDRVKSNNRAAA